MSEYYQGHDVAVRFDVFKDGKPAVPSSASVLAYGPDSKLLCRDKAGIQGNEVNFALDGEYVEKTGRYSFVFECKIKGLGDYTHIVNATVKKMPVKER